MSRILIVMLIYRRYKLTDLTPPLVLVSGNDL
jgi:hypothetical protein